MSDEWQGKVQAIVNDAERSSQYLIPNTQSKIPRLRLSYGGKSNILISKYPPPSLKLRRAKQYQIPNS